MEQGSPLRQAVDGDAVAAQIDLESMSLEDALKEAEDKVRQALEDEINPPTPHENERYSHMLQRYHGHCWMN